MSEAVLRALSLTGSMAWEILRALVFGFTVSSIVQAVVRGDTITSMLGDDRRRALAVATGLGMASSRRVPTPRSHWPAPYREVLDAGARRVEEQGCRRHLHVVCDGLTELPQAIETVWPPVITQTCIVHLLRNSFRYASKKDWPAIAKDLSRSTPPSESAALDAFVAFGEQWGDRYPAIIRQSRSHRPRTSALVQPLEGRFECVRGDLRRTPVSRTKVEPTQSVTPNT